MQIKELITAPIARAYLSSQHRILFLDFDGTLVAFNDDPESVTLDEPTISLLQEAVSIPGNHIVIISGRSKSFLEKTIPEIGVTMVAEHGLYIREPGKSWTTTEKVTDGWKKDTMVVLEQITSEFNGSMIELKNGSLAWHYRKCRVQPDAVTLGRIIRQIGLATDTKDISFLLGNRVLEIKHSKYTKGTAALKLLDNKHYDFILAIGDDTTDEDLFRSLPAEAFTIKIGHGSTAARMKFDNRHEALLLLQKLTHIAPNIKKGHERNF
jgi:trehalose 6-phosphate synthase/phosphatase